MGEVGGRSRAMMVMVWPLARRMVAVARPVMLGEGQWGFFLGWWSGWWWVDGLGSVLPGAEDGDFGHCDWLCSCVSFLCPAGP